MALILNRTVVLGSKNQDHFDLKIETTIGAHAHRRARARDERAKYELAFTEH